METASIRVLLIEEDPLERALIREYLEIPGGIQILDSETDPRIFLSPLLDISVVLIDMEPSKVDGIGRILELRKGWPHLPILGMTDRQADPYNNSRLRGVSIGFLRKPFSAFGLHQSLMATLRTYSIGSANRALPEKGLLRNPSIRSGSVSL
jgi:DNA-binding NarL/FixJ family response regulator